MGSSAQPGVNTAENRTGNSTQPLRLVKASSTTGGYSTEAICCSSDEDYFRDNGTQKARTAER